MRIYLFIVLVIATVWDAFTTVFGTVQVLGNGLIQIIAAILFSALIFGFVLNTRRIMQWPSGFASVVAKLFFFIAVSYDLYTSWLGNSMLVIRGDGGSGEVIILIGLTILVTASPILLSTMLQRGSRGEGHREGSPNSAEPRTTS